MSLMRVRRVGSGLGNTPHGAGCGAVLDRVAAPVSGNPCGQRREELRSNLVLAGLVPTIHVFVRRGSKPWMPGSQTSLRGPRKADRYGRT